MTFKKWTKINVQKWKKYIVLLTKKFDLIKKNYHHKINLNEKIYDRNFFIFFEEKYLGIFSLALVS